MGQHGERHPDLGDELRSLGANLKKVLEEAWRSEERERLMQEIESGLKEAAETLRAAAADFEHSPTGRRLKSEMQDIGDKMRVGALQGEVRSELVDILSKLNSELQAAASRLSDRRPTGDQDGPP